MPSGDEVPAGYVANIIAAIDRLSPKERAQVYTQLLSQRRGPDTRAQGVPNAGATVLPNAATELASPVTVLPSHVTARPRSAPAARATPQPRTYLPESGASSSKADFAAVAASVRKLLEIVIFDPDGIASPSLRSNVRQLVESALNGISASPSLIDSKIVFEVHWTNRELRARDRVLFGPMQCPVYLADDDKSGSNIIKIIDEHQYPKFVPFSTHNVRRHVKDEWGGGLRGTAVPPGPGAGFNRMIFLKKSVFSEGDRLGNKTLVSNALLHEFGHACNIFTHATDGTVMTTRLTTERMSSKVLPYRRRDADAIIREVERLWSLKRSHS